MTRKTIKFTLHAVSDEQIRSLSTLLHARVVSGEIGNVTIKTTYRTFCDCMLLDVVRVIVEDATPEAVEATKEHLSIDTPGMPGHRTLPGDWMEVASYDGSHDGFAILGGGGSGGSSGSGASTAASGGSGSSGAAVPGNGRIYAAHGSSPLRHVGDLKDGVFTESTKPGEWTEYDDLRPMTPAPRKCECGSTAAGSPRHSTWCPLFEDDKRRDDQDDEPWGTD